MRPLPLLILFVAYFATAKLGIALPVGEGLVTPVWAPTGIAVAALTLGGWRLWPAVYLAAFLANVTSGGGILLALGIAIGNTGQAVFGAWLLRRWGIDTALARMKDVMTLVAAAAVSCVVSATNGTTMLLAFDAVSADGYVSRWRLWWFGDVMGVLVVGALIFAVHAYVRSGRRPTPARALEFTVVLALLGLVSALVFLAEAWRYPALMVPMWIWLALRFRAVGSTAATLLISMVGIGSTIAGGVVLQGATATQTVQILQAMLAIVGICLLAVATALTERDRALEAEREAMHELRMIDEMKDSLLAAVSHELRTPLTSILALSMMLRDRHATLDEAKLEEMYDHLTRESRRLDLLLNDLLDLERLRMGVLTANFEPVDLPNIVHHTLERYQHDTRPLRLDLAPVTVMADTSKVKRIVDNLIGNAYKHSPYEGKVSITVREVDGGAEIAVDDEGAGVPDELKQSIFEPFNRGASDVSAVPGTGIGLSLVAHFTELHHGRAWVQDRDGGGSSFRVFLPSTPA